MKTRLLLSLVVTFGVLLAHSVVAHALDVESVQKILSAKDPKIKVEKISPAPVKGFHEVITMNKEIFYMDDTGRFLLVGNLIDTKGWKSLTSERHQEISKIDFSSLPLEKAVKFGKGSRKIAVFDDPDCPYCRKLHAELKMLDGVEIYVFLYPLPNHPRAFEKSIAIWCSSDRVQALHEAMEGKEVKLSTCDAKAVEETIDLGRRLGIASTPTIFLDSGMRIGGYLPAAEITKRLQSP
jgi:thiol:disulfide interchange protein DsbC